MRGVFIKKATIISEDERRRIFSILNGEIGIRDIHILEVKKGTHILGNHYHSYKEICFCYKGSCKYKLKHMITGEEEEVEFKQGDIMIRDAYIAHTCVVSEDCILIDGTECSWIDENINHYQEKLI